MIRRLRDLRRDDSGFTLVELVIYCILLIVVMTIASVLFVQMIRAQRDITDMAGANNTAQITFKELERDTRNASTVRIADSGNLLVVRTRIATDGNPDSWQCVGYYLDTTTNKLHVTRSVSPTQTHSILAQTTSGGMRAAAATWPVAREGFMKIGTARAFGTVDGSLVYPNSVPVRLQADSENGRDPVKMTKTVTLRPQGAATLDCM